MRATLAAIGLLAVTLAGGQDDALPADDGIGPPQGTWTDAGADNELWAAFSWGCGFCSGDPELAEFELVAVHLDGKAILLQYARAGGEPSPGWMRNGLEPWRAEVATILAQARAYAESDEAYEDTPARDRPVRVLGLAAAQVPADDWQGLEARLAQALGDLREPTGSIGATDCGPAVLEVLGPQYRRAAAGCGIDGGQAWTDATGILDGLAAWLRSRAPATVPARLGGHDVLLPSLAHQAGVPPLVRSDAPLTVEAAFVQQACGGLLHGCSGVSGVLLRSDGAVVAFWGGPWDAGRQRTTDCGAYASLIGTLEDEFGEGWHVTCANGGLEPRGGQMGPAAHAAILSALEGLGPLQVEDGHAVPQCCDRVFTEVRMHIAGREAAFAWEGTDAEGAHMPDAAWAQAYSQLRALAPWLRPSNPGPWSPPPLA